MSDFDRYKVMKAKRMVSVSLLSFHETAAAHKLIPR